jgi:hypothetical protein
VGNKVEKINEENNNSNDLFQEFIKKAEAIQYLVPGATYAEINGEIKWDLDTPIPTDQEISETIIFLEIKKAEVKKRNERNYLLASSDWTVSNGSPLSEEKQAEWMTYRQELRDFPNQQDWVTLPFPNKPE